MTEPRPAVQTDPTIRVLFSGAQIQERVRGNWAQLTALAPANPACSVLPAEAGWYAVVQVPAIASEDTIVLDLLEHTGVLVHPGYFFDFEHEAYLVVSLIVEPDVFDRGVARILARAAQPDQKV